MSLAIICNHRWGAPTPTSFQNDKGEMVSLVLRYCPGCVTTWRADFKEPRVITGYLEESAPKIIQSPVEPIDERGV